MAPHACVATCIQLLDVRARGAGIQAFVIHVLASLTKDLGQHGQARLDLVVSVEEKADRTVGLEDCRSHLAHMLDGLLAHLGEELVLRITRLGVVQHELNRPRSRRSGHLRAHFRTFHSWRPTR